MTRPHDIDHIFDDWPYQPGVISARLVEANDGREVVQMRIELGVLQMEAVGRPDGEQPEGMATYLEHLIEEAITSGDEFTLDPDQCYELDREFIQFYHRRICWLALREFQRAIEDAEHTLAMMDFVAAHSPEPEWTVMHEQYRPFVVFHHAQASAMLAVQRKDAEGAVEELNRGLSRMRSIYETAEAVESFEQSDLVGQLTELKETLRQEYRLGPTLTEQLADAVAAEQYERAARIRDQMRRRGA
jgi:hypothetical protein